MCHHTEMDCTKVCLVERHKNFRDYHLQYLISVLDNFAHVWSCKTQLVPVAWISWKPCSSQRLLQQSYWREKFNAQNAKQRSPQNRGTLYSVWESLIHSYSLVWWLLANWFDGNGWCYIIIEALIIHPYVGM